MITGLLQKSNRTCKDLEKRTGKPRGDHHSRNNQRAGGHNAYNRRRKKHETEDPEKNRSPRSDGGGGRSMRRGLKRREKGLKAAILDEPKHGGVGGENADKKYDASD